MFIDNNYASRTSFSGHHLPKKFSSMMNYIYKKTFNNYPDIFESKNIVRVSTQLDNGEEVSGYVNFHNGKYNGLVLDKGYEHLKQVFMRTALRRYNEKVATPRVKEKLFNQQIRKGSI